MTEQLTGGQILVKSLQAHNVDTIFGIPGIQLYGFFDALYDAQDDINVIVPRHEQSTTYMADGYARVNDKPGIATVVPGPGVLNALAGVSTAWSSSVPMLLICGQIARDLVGDRVYGALHELPDQTATLNTLTKWVGTARRPEEIPDLVRQAFYHMTEGVPGPVVLEVSPDVLEETGTYTPVTPLQVPETALTEAQLDALTETLLAAKRPYILAGGGALSARAGEELCALAERLNCPILQSKNGRGVVPTADPHTVDPVSRGLVIEDADLVIAVGTRLGSSRGGTVELGTSRVVNINARLDHLGYPRPAAVHAVLGDAKAIVGQLVAHLESVDIDGASTWDIPALRDAAARERAEKVASIQPQSGYIDAISETFSRDSVFVAEYTQVGYLSLLAYPIGENSTFIQPGFQGSLGYGFATALGAQVGTPDRRVISISGDGGFAWTMPELATMKKYRIPLVTIVFHDGRYGNVYRSQKYEFKDRVIGSELENPDYELLALAHGIPFHRVDSPEGLREVLEECANAEPQPVFIEVRVAEMPSAWHLFDEPGP